MKQIIQILLYIGLVLSLTLTKTLMANNYGESFKDKLSLTMSLDSSLDSSLEYRKDSKIPVTFKLENLSKEDLNLIVKTFPAFLSFYVSNDNP